MSKTPSKKRTRFTAGPWKAHLNVPTAVIPGHIIKIDDDIERPIALLWEGGGRSGKPEQIANAHLIAAAPDLFAACERMVRMFELFMKKANHAASFYDADTLHELNAAPIEAHNAVAKALGGAK